MVLTRVANIQPVQKETVQTPNTGSKLNSFQIIIVDGFFIESNGHGKYHPMLVKQHGKKKEGKKKGRKAGRKEEKKDKKKRRKQTNKAKNRDR